MSLILHEIEISFRHVHKELSVTGVRDLEGVAGYTCVHEEVSGWGNHFKHGSSRSQLKCDDTRAETRFRLSVKRTSPFKSAVGRQFSRLLAAEVCASAVVMLGTPCSEVV